MPSRTILLAVVAAVALVVGAALSFFELIILGIVAGVAAGVLALRGAGRRSRDARARA
jgi:hypothetical protein